LNDESLSLFNIFTGANAFIMKKIFFIFLFAFLSGTYIMAQTENPDTKELTKEEKKALKKAKKEEQKLLREEALTNFEKYANDREWVIEAYLVFDKAGQSYPMDPNINFVGVDKEQATFQLSFNGIMGWNGVGGITLDGKISTYSVSKSKSVLSIKMTVMGARMGPADILMTVSGDGNSNATVSGNWGDRITFKGKFVPLAESTVYKGTTTY